MAYSIHKKEKMKADVSTETRMSKDNGRLFKILVENHQHNTLYLERCTAKVKAR
jgi:hypothetical protein